MNAEHRGLAVVAGVQVAAVGLLVGGDGLLGPAQPVRGLGQRVEVVGLELGAGRRERVVGSLPVAARERGAGGGQSRSIAADSAAGSGLTWSAGCRRRPRGWRR